jgi:hypothetical protein
MFVFIDLEGSNHATPTFEPDGGTPTDELEHGGFLLGSDKVIEQGQRNVVRWPGLHLSFILSGPQHTPVAGSGLEDPEDCDDYMCHSDGRPWDSHYMRHVSPCILSWQQ